MLHYFEIQILSIGHLVSQNNMEDVTLLFLKAFISHSVMFVIFVRSPQGSLGPPLPVTLNDAVDSGSGGWLLGGLLM